MILAPMSDIYGGQCQAPGVPPAFTYATVPAGATTIPGATYYIPQQSRKRGLVPDAGPMATMSMNSMITVSNEWMWMKKVVVCLDGHHKKASGSDSHINVRH